MNLNDQALKIISALATIICCFAGSLLIGILIFGTSIFNSHESSFQFVILGLLGGIIFSVLKYYSVRDALFVVFLFFILDVALFKMTSFRSIVRDILFISGSFGAIFIYRFYFQSKLEKLDVGKFLTFASIYTLSTILITIVAALIFNVEHTMRPFLLVNITRAFLVGTGVGIGFEIADKICPDLIEKINLSGLPGKSEV